MITEWGYVNIFIVFMTAHHIFNIIFYFWFFYFKVVIAADSEPKNLMKLDETEFGDADRALMDDLKITKDSVSINSYSKFRFFKFIIVFVLYCTISKFYI